MALNQRWQRCGRSCPPHPHKLITQPYSKVSHQSFSKLNNSSPIPKVIYSHIHLNNLLCQKKYVFCGGVCPKRCVSKYKCCGVFVTIDVCQNSSAVGCLSQSDLESTTSSARLTESPTCICCLRTSSISNICTQENLQKRHLVLKLSPLPLLAPWSQSILLV